MTLRPAILLLALAPATHAGLVPLDVHLDLAPSYVGGQMQQEIIYVAPGDLDETERPFEDVFLVVPDRPLVFNSSNDGTRYNRSAGANGPEYDFVGVAPDENFWWLTQNDNNICWPGIDNRQFGVFDSYVEPDFSFNGSQPWITVSLIDLRYQGPGIGQFAMFTGFPPSETIWMNAKGSGTTAVEKELDATDRLLMFEGGHDHVNWTFSDPGLYFLDLQSSGYLTHPTTQVTSDVNTLVAAVGSFAIWQAEQFDLPVLSDESLSGPTADPDKDKRTNLEEYAFGTDPNTPDQAELTVENVGGVMKVGFRRRTADTSPGVTYQARFGAGFPTNSWIEGTTETTTPLEAGWEFVEVEDPAPGGAKRFAEIELQLQDGQGGP